MAQKPIGLRMDPALIERIDAAKGEESRATFITRAVEAALGGTTQPASSAGRPREAGSTPARSAPSQASAKSAPPDYGMEHQRRLNDAKYGRRS